uniref:Uncharacterized protein n=1 Tax=Kalanchoe fedtschenkoi TaxID=63787 RepID=A0A7N0T516_KALFE
MEPDPNEFPILAYVMSNLHDDLAPSATDADDQLHERRPRDGESAIVAKMPHLADPGMLRAMAEAVSGVAQTRSVLETLGPRPGPEEVGRARERAAEIESRLSRALGELVTAPRPEGVERLRWRAMVAERESEIRKAAEEEKRKVNTVVQVDEMFGEYERMVGAAEERLRMIYEGGEAAAAEEGLREEVVGILKESRVLERVELRGRRLRYLPEAFGMIRGLVVMDLSNNLLQMIPDSIGGLENLEELKLSSNLLESLPDSIGLLLKLKIFDVSANKLTELPGSIGRCKSLIELDVSFNNLKCLPANIGDNLVHVTKLSVQLNKLRSLPASICEMRSLRALDAHFNELRGLPLAIGQLHHLETLNLSSNFTDLTELPDSIGDLFNLKDLDLSNNQILTLPDTFGRLHNLRKLNLDQNPLEVPPQDVISKGVEAVKTFMGKRWLDILAEEERRSMVEMQEQTQTGWLTRSTSWLNQVAAGVSESVSGYLSPRSPRDTYLDQQL